jgi:hypothetical protein
MEKDLYKRSNVQQYIICISRNRSQVAMIIMLQRLSLYFEKYPRVKKLLAIIVQSLLYFPKRKDFKFVINESVTVYKTFDIPGKNTFWGYYDKSPFNPFGGNLVLYNDTESPFNKFPNPKIATNINIHDLSTNTSRVLDKTFSWNWQQGCRLHWISNDRIIYNTYNSGENAYQSKIMNVHSGESKTLSMAIYDTYSDEYALCLNYSRLMLLRPDYGYFNLKISTRDIHKAPTDDGIWYLNLKDSKSRQIVSLSDLRKKLPYHQDVDAYHKVNHIMISPSGATFIFLHRWIVKGKTFDRLYLYNLSSDTMVMILDSSRISHYSWVDDDNIIITASKNNIFDYYIFNVKENSMDFVQDDSLRDFGDGHPSVSRVNKNIVITDTYPDRSRFRKLILIDRSKKSHAVIAEVFEPLTLWRETRCDCHPNFSPDGNYIHFDTAHLNKRCLTFLEL